MSIPPQVHARMRELTDLLTAANKAYYVAAASSLTDAEYDTLNRELASLEASTGFSFPGSPTRVVGSDLSGSFKKVKHQSPMLSLDNVFSVSDITRFFGDAALDCDVLVEPKLDGVSLSLEYVHGTLQVAKTRGNGEEGEDVTANAKTVVGIPLQLSSPVTVEIRGEVVLRRAQLEKINLQRVAEGEAPFANPRNAASGTLKQKSPLEVARRKLNFIAYHASFDASWAATQQESYARLAQFGFTTATNFGGIGRAIPLQRTEQLSHAIKAIQDLKPTLDIDLDGAVVKINSFAVQEKLGLKTKSPRWACAFKFPPERVSTELLAIELTVGRTGQITPNARLKPVCVEGAMVANASLMNADEIVRIGNPTPGDIVLVERSAAVIPRVVEVQTPNNPIRWEFPTTCPSCQTPLQRHGVHYYCVDHTNCREQVMARLRHAVAKYALDWDGLGEAALKTLYTSGCCFLSDLFGITDTKADEIFKPAAAKKFKAERERVKTVPFWRQLVALGIEDVGQTLSKEIATKYQSLANLIVAIDSSYNLDSTDELLTLMGPVASASLRNYLDENIGEVARLQAFGMTFAADPTLTGPLSGKTMVITGTLMGGGRDTVSSWLESLGATMKSSVGKTTSYLICGEAPGGNKTDAAAKYGIKVLAEEELYELLGQRPSQPGV